MNRTTLGHALMIPSSVKWLTILRNDEEVRGRGGIRKLSDRQDIGWIVNQRDMMPLEYCVDDVKRLRCILLEKALVKDISRMRFSIGIPADRINLGLLPPSHKSKMKEVVHETAPELLGERFYVGPCRLRGDDNRYCSSEEEG
ncbi:hypothetical protein Tco_0909116 [Tanacetum coccineum]|uniref:Uncharacterized protein n=1 Tax=Tanacetum coccineum TaxID=301880 RepID=A0ABQ5CP32_9ASTR